jgi:hypothetical protein
MWFIGDGQLDKQTGFIKLHTNSFSKIEVDFLCSLLKDFESKPLKKDNDFLVTIPHRKVSQFLNYIGKCPFTDYQHKWQEIEYKNKNIELNGFTYYNDFYPLIEEDYKTTNCSICSLHKKYNVPVTCIKHYFNTKGIIWEPKKIEKIVIQYDLKGTKIKEWNSGFEIKKELNFSNSAISECCRNKRKTHKGFIWKFK